MENKLREHHEEKTENLNDLNLKLKEDNDKLNNYVKSFDNILKGTNKVSKNKEKEDTEKDFLNSIKNMSDNKIKLYDLTKRLSGINIYRIEGKKEIKKVKKILIDAKRNMDELERILEGEATYKVQNNVDDSLIEYLNSIDPKNKGLYFKEQQIRDMNILLRNMELDYESSINNLDKKIEGLDAQIRKYEDTNTSAETLRNLKKQKIFFKRNKDLRKQRISYIRATIDKYISDHEQIETDIRRAENTLEYTRKLYNFVEHEIKLIETHYVPNGKDGTSKTNESMRNLKEIGERLKEITTKDVSGKIEQEEAMYKQIDQVISTESGQSFAKEMLLKSRAIYNKQSADKKAIRDNYFKEIGY